MSRERPFKWFTKDKQKKIGLNWQLTDENGYNKTLKYTLQNDMI